MSWCARRGTASRGATSFGRGSSDDPATRAPSSAPGRRRAANDDPSASGGSARGQDDSGCSCGRARDPRAIRSADRRAPDRLLSHRRRCRADTGRRSTGIPQHGSPRRNGCAQTRPIGIPCDGPGLGSHARRRASSRSPLGRCVRWGLGSCIAHAPVLRERGWRRPPCQLQSQRIQNPPF